MTPQTQQRKERPPVFLKGKRAYQGTGRRKSAVARVFATEGSGQISINGRSLDQFFTEAKDRNAVVGPLVVTDLRTRIDLTIRVNGGGITGQSGACCQGVARALKVMFGLDKVAAPQSGPQAQPHAAEAEAAAEAGAEGGATESADDAIVTMAKRLRDSGYLTRDGRMKERKKYGRKGARKSFQFSKR